MLLVPPLYTFADDMVGNASERLQRNNLADAVVRQITNLARQKPSFAKVCRGVEGEILI